MTRKNTQQLADKHRQSGFALIVVGLVGALFFVPAGFLILVGIGELVYSLTLRPVATASPTPTAPLTEQLEEIDTLHRSAKISDEEYQRLRAKLLGGTAIS